MISKQTSDTERICAAICDRYCKYPQIFKDQWALDKICDKCPLNELVNVHLDGREPK